MGLLDLLNGANAPAATATSLVPGIGAAAAAPTAGVPTGLLGLLLGPNNPAAQWAGTNRGLLGAIGAGLAQGPSLGQGLANAAQLVPQARAMDMQTAEKTKADAKVTAQENATQAWLKANYPQYADLPVQEGFQLALKDIGGGGNSPSSVQEWEIAKKGGYTGTYVDWMQTGRNAASVPSGYQRKADGSGLEPIPGGPSDPNTAYALSPEALDLIATQYLAGDKSAITGYARNANMRAQIANAIAEKANARGMDGKSIAAEVSAYGGNVAAQRSAGSRAAQVGMAASEANQMADVALEASSKVPRGNFMPWNAAMNAVATNTSSPEMAAFVTATTSLVNAYARAVSPLGAPTDAMRKHAEDMLNTAQSPEAYAAVIAQMKKEMEAALNAPAEISQQLKSAITGSSSEGGNDPLGIRGGK